MFTEAPGVKLPGNKNTKTPSGLLPASRVITEVADVVASTAV